MNIKHEGTAGKKMNFWNLVFENEKMDGKWTDLPLRNIPFPSLDNPSFPPEIKNILTSPKSTKLQLLQPSKRGGAHYATSAKANNKVF